MAAATATIRDLRTRFPRIRRLLDEEGEILVTDHGRPIAVLRPFHEQATRRVIAIDYFARLRRRMPRPITRAARRALDQADRDDR